MTVRFKEKYCADINNRIAYELVSDKFVEDENGERSVELKLIGIVPVRKLELAEDTDKSAIDVFVKLSNL